jgi:acyl carrier protein
MRSTIVSKLRNRPEWQAFRKAMNDHGVDPNLVAEIGEFEGDSLDFVEMTMALEEAFGWSLDLSRKS